MRHVALCRSNAAPLPSPHRSRAPPSQKCVALVVLAVLVMLGGGEHQVQAEPLQPWLVLPYLLVFALALSGLNVLAV